MYSSNTSPKKEFLPTVPKVSTQNIILIIGVVSLSLSAYYFFSSSNSSHIYDVPESSVSDQPNSKPDLNNPSEIDISKLPPEIRSQAKELANLGNVVEALKNEDLDERIRQANLVFEKYKEQGLAVEEPVKAEPPDMKTLKERLDAAQQFLDEGSSQNNQN